MGEQKGRVWELSPSFCAAQIKMKRANDAGCPRGHGGRTLEMVKVNMNRDGNDVTSDTSPTRPPSKTPHHTGDLQAHSEPVPPQKLYICQSNQAVGGE